MRTVCLILCSALVLLGCDRTYEDVPYYRLPDSAVVAAVGDIRCTKGDVRMNENVLARLIALSGGQAVADMAGFRKNYLETFVTQALLVREAAKRGVKLEDADVRNQQTRFLASMPGAQGADFRDVVAGLGPLAPVFESNMRREALANKMEDLLRGEFAKRNASASAFATNAWKSIRAGNDFDVVGKKLVEMGKKVVYEDKSAAPAGILPQLSVGALSPLIATEGGLSMWKVKADATGEKVYSRIFFSIPSVHACFDAWLAEQKKAPDVILKIK